MTSQPGILDPLPTTATFVTLALTPAATPKQVLERLRSLDTGRSLVVGIGQPLAARLHATVPGLSSFPEHAGLGASIPVGQTGMFLTYVSGSLKNLDDPAHLTVAATLELT